LGDNIPCERASADHALGKASLPALHPMSRSGGTAATATNQKPVDDHFKVSVVSSDPKEGFLRNWPDGSCWMVKHQTGHIDFEQAIDEARKFAPLEPEASSCHFSSQFPGTPRAFQPVNVLLI
jgi:hypothetical protein